MPSTSNDGLRSHYFKSSSAYTFVNGANFAVDFILLNTIIPFSLITNEPDRMVQTDSLSRTFGALADPTRRAILARLSKGDLTVNEVAQPFEMTLGAVSKHLKVLENAGLVTRGRESQWRPCKLEALPMREAVIWLSAYRDEWEHKFQKLDDVLEDLKREEANSRYSKSRKGKGHGD